MKKSFLLIPLLIFIFSFLSSDTNISLEQTTSKGLRLSLEKDQSLMFVHAEIVLYYSGIKNPSVPFLTSFNIFDNQINDPRSGILNTLFKMGNDFKIEHRVDHIILKLNFLPADIHIFMNFIKELFNYKGFSLKKFNYSIKNFWTVLRKNQDWKSIVASQIAFSKLFGKDYPASFLVRRKNISSLNLSHIRSFYKNNYKLSNSFLTIQGDINPYVVFGLLEKAFKNFNKRESNFTKFKYNVYSDKREVTVVDTESVSTPIVYWIEPLPSNDKISHHETKIINNILFGYPFGRISRSASAAGIKNFNIMGKIHDHRNISILCNTIKVGYRDVEKFIFIADNTIRKLGKGRIGRKEYLDSYNLVYQKKKITSDDYEYKAMTRITNAFFRLSGLNDNIEKKIQLKNLSYANFNKIFSDPSSNYNAGRNKKKGIIVIFGKASLILKYLKNTKAEVINLR